MSPNYSPFFICGSTASGKSAIALELAERVGGEVVNADAYQIYQGLEILSACPSEEERARCPHHLYSSLGLETSLNANLYREMALPLISEIQARGKVPLVTGGSGMYLKFLTHGPSPIPASDPKVRESLEERPLEDLLAELTERDPEVLQTFPPENKRYVIRALEICLMTGQKASELKADWETLPTPPPRGLLVSRSKEETLSSIEKRADEMLSTGAIEEVESLPADDMMPTARKAIGVQEIQKYLAGEWTLEECRERLVISTRQYAKRQRNWFRKETWLQTLEVHKGSYDLSKIEI